MSQKYWKKATKTFAHNNISSFLSCMIETWQRHCITMNLKPRKNTELWSARRPTEAEGCVNPTASSGNFTQSRTHYFAKSWTIQTLEYATHMILQTKIITSQLKALVHSVLLMWSSYIRSYRFYGQFLAPIHGPKRNFNMRFFYGQFLSGLVFDSYR